MAMEEESQSLTALITPLGLYKWKRLPMGLASAPGAFQNIKKLIFAGLSYEMALGYLDDVIVFGRNFDEHLKQLEQIFPHFVENGLKIMQSKCNFVGYIISQSGVEVDPEKERAVEKMKEPSSLTDLRVFLGLVGYYRKFIPGFGKTAEPLYSLLNKSTSRVSGKQVHFAYW